VALQEVDRLKALLVSSQASEQLAEKKTARRHYPRALSRRDQDAQTFILENICACRVR